MSFLFRALMCALVTVCLSGQSQSRRQREPLPELVTDRPGFTESPEVIGAGILQLESGFHIDRAARDGVRRHSNAGPYPLVRLGVGKRVELRYSGDGYHWDRLFRANSSESLRGYADFTVGAKVNLLHQSRFAPDFGVIGAVGIPKGNRHFVRTGYEPDVKLCLAKDAPVGFVLSGMVNFAAISDDHGRLFPTAYSISAGHALWKDLSAFVETYTITLGRFDGRSTLFDGGVTHPVGRNAQVDMYVGRALFGKQADWFLGVGFSVRQSLLPGLRR